MECRFSAQRQFAASLVFSIFTLFVVPGWGPIAGAESVDELARSAHWSHRQLQTTPADDLRVELALPTENLRFADCVYGTPDSRRVAIAVCDTPDGPEFYVDVDRNRVMEASERVPGAGNLRMLRLDAEHVVDFVFNKHPRKVLLRWAPGDQRLGIATSTRKEHAINQVVGTKERYNARQIDGNANGLFADRKDFVEIDINADGRVDPFLETFPLRPVMTIDGKRWSVRADPFGKRLALELASATGTVQLKTAARSDRDRITELIVTFSGDDGSVYSVSGSAGSTELPVGRYAASVLYVAIKPAHSGRRWEYTFSRRGSASGQDWIEVTEDERVVFDPIGELEMNAEVEASSPRKRGTLVLQPRLYTASGLLINVCRIDGQNSINGPQCQMSIAGMDGNVIGQTQSGFA